MIVITYQDGSYSRSKTSYNALVLWYATGAIKKPIPEDMKLGQVYEMGEVKIPAEHRQFMALLSSCLERNHNISIKPRPDIPEENECWEILNDLYEIGEFQSIRRDQT